MGNRQVVTPMADGSATILKILERARNEQEARIKRTAKLESNDKLFTEFLTKARECYEKKEGDHIDCVKKHLPRTFVSFSDPEHWSHSSCASVILEQTIDYSQMPQALSCLHKSYTTTDN